MTNQTPEERIDVLEASLKFVTDQVGKVMDRILKKGFIPAFRCSHSGLLLPVDYIKEWGRKYGIGLGPSPVSEVLNSDYDSKPAKPKKFRHVDQIMHPVGNSFAQVDFDLFDPEELPWAVLEKDDNGMEKRAAIIIQKQLVNPKSKIRLFRAAYEGTA